MGLEVIWSTSFNTVTVPVAIEMSLFAFFFPVLEADVSLKEGFRNRTPPITGVVDPGPVVVSLRETYFLFSGALLQPYRVGGRCDERHSGSSFMVPSSRFCFCYWDIGIGI